MKILIISDTHISNKFDLKKFERLRKLFEEVDKIIINGDFWDHHKTTLDEFLRSKWSQLFPILKAKHTIYIYGNHDDDIVFDKVKVFCDKVSQEAKLQVNKSELVITHGQEVVKYLNGIHVFIDKTPILHKPIGLILDIVIRIGGRMYLKIAYSKMNNEMKNWAKANLQNNQLLVCGHSHLQEMDIANQFIDLGGNTNGLNQYAIVENTTLTLYSENLPTYSHTF